MPVLAEANALGFTPTEPFANSTRCDHSCGSHDQPPLLLFEFLTVLLLLYHTQVKKSSILSEIHKKSRERIYFSPSNLWRHMFKAEPPIYVKI
jgi:hypothetical protein